MLVFQSMQRGSTEVPRLEDDYPFSETEIFDKPGYPRMHFVEKRYSQDPTNWWIPNRACVEAMLRSSGFRHRGPSGRRGVHLPAEKDGQRVDAEYA